MFNNYFNSIVKELNITIEQNLSNDASISDDPIVVAVRKYKRHPSILKINEKAKKYDHLSFYHVNINKMLKIFQNIDSEKATQQGDIPVRIGILYKADPDQDPDLQKKWILEIQKKRTLYQNLLYELKDSFLTNLRVLISNMTIVF